MGHEIQHKKCNITRVSHSRKPLQHFYSLGSEILQEVSDAKYLGIQIDNKLDWNKHISKFAARGQSKLAFLKRNLKGYPKKLRDTAYISLIRPPLEYSCSVWQSNKAKIEKVQRRAARFVSNNFRRKATVSEMLHNLGGNPLTVEGNTNVQSFSTKLLMGSRRLKRRTSSCQPTPVQGRITASNSNTSRQIVIHIGFLFFPATISSWNNLPFGNERVDSVEGFKLKLKEYTIRSPDPESNIGVILSLESCQLNIRINHFIYSDITVHSGC